MSFSDKEMTMDDISSYVNSNQEKISGLNGVKMEERVKQIKGFEDKVEEATVEIIDGKSYIIIESKSF